MLRLDKFFSFLLSLLFLMQSKKLLIVLSIYLNELKKACFKKLNLLRSYVVVDLALKGFMNKCFCHDALLAYKVEILA